MIIRTKIKVFILFYSLLIFYFPNISFSEQKMLNILRYRSAVRIFFEGFLILFIFRTTTEKLTQYISIYKGSNGEANYNQYSDSSFNTSRYGNSPFVLNNGIDNDVNVLTYKRSHFFVEGDKRSIFEKWKLLNKKEKLEYKINYDIGLNIDAQIGDFGDYNSDVKTDLILYKHDETKLITVIYVYIFDVKESKFTYNCETVLNGKVKNIISVDWNFDGLLDILVLFTDFNGNEKNYYLSAFIQDENSKLVEIWNSQRKEKEKEPISEKENLSSFYYTNIHPLIFDINNDGYLDLICQQNDNNKFVRFLWINNKKNGFRSVTWDSFTNLEYEIKNKEEQEVKQIGEISNPHSSAIVDLNGDCKSDLVFTIYNEKNNNISLEIWLNTMDNGKGVYRKLETNYELPVNSLQILFGDFNADGSMDLLVPSCQKSKSCNNCCVGNDKIYFIPNIQKKICEKTWTQVDQTQCRPVHNLCSESDFHFLSPVDDIYVSIIDENNNLHFTGDDEHPQYLSIGDIDNDGYLDCLITLKTNDENKYVRIYKNELKAYDEKNNVEVRNFYNFYQFIMSSNESETRNIYNSAFFDIFENGILDILIFGKYTSSKKNESKYTAVSFIRSNETDSLFLKATSLNGICVNNCYKNGSTGGKTNAAGSGNSTENRKPFGTNVQGPTFKITVIDSNGVKTSRIGVQRSQSSHSPLQLPYVIFGLGRTSNYVEEFYLGMPTQDAKYFNMWVSIIPNSHIIVIPYPLNNSNEWKIQLSVNPSNKIYSIIYITLICLAIIGLLIFILDRKEKIEDMKEEKGFKSHFVIG